jgi:hypothetical protein
MTTTSERGVEQLCAATARAPGSGAPADARLDPAGRSCRAQLFVAERWHRSVPTADRWVGHRGAHGRDGTGHHATRPASSATTPARRRRRPDVPPMCGWSGRSAGDFPLDRAGSPRAGRPPDDRGDPPRRFRAAPDPSPVSLGRCRRRRGPSPVTASSVPLSMSPEPPGDSPSPERWSSAVARPCGLVPGPPMPHGVVSDPCAGRDRERPRQIPIDESPTRWLIYETKWPSPHHASMPSGTQLPCRTTRGCSVDDLQGRSSAAMRMINGGCKLWPASSAEPETSYASAHAESGIGAERDERGRGRHQ